MIPEFTAEASLGRGRARHVTTRRSASREPLLVAQQRVVVGPDRGPDGGGALEWGGAGQTITCPGCRTHPCGFLGLHTCLTCC